MEYVNHLVVLIAVYGSVACALNVLSGHAGLVSLCTAVFYGLGAYSTGLLSIAFGWGWLATLGAGFAISGIAAVLLGLASLRFRDEYFVIATLAFQVLIWSVMENWTIVTQGPLGLSGIPPPTLFGVTIGARWLFSVIAIAYLGVTVLIIGLLSKAPYGRVLRAIREDEIFPLALGKNVRAFRVSAFAVSAIFAAGAGSIYATYISYIDPSLFSLQESIFMLSIVIIGGSRRVAGPLLGAAFLVSFPEALRFLGLSPVHAAGLRQALYGLLLVVVILFRPRGVVGDYGFDR